MASKTRSHIHTNSHTHNPHPYTSSTMSRTNSASSSGTSPLVSPTGSEMVTSSSTVPRPPATRTSSWDDVLSHASSQRCGGTALGSGVKGPCKPIGRTDGVVICWWCSRWLGTFETWNPPVKPPMHANVYCWEDDHEDGFFA